MAGGGLMPLYQYVCEQCGHEFEVMTTIDRRDEALCPKCGGSVKRSWQGTCAFGNMKYSGGGKSACCEQCEHCHR